MKVQKIPVEEIIVKWTYTATVDNFAKKWTSSEVFFKVFNHK